MVTPRKGGIENYGEADAKQGSFEHGQENRKAKRRERELKDYVPREDNIPEALQDEDYPDSVG